MRFLAGAEKPQPWAARLGWDRGITHRVFSGKQLPGPEALAQLAQAERVNIAWLLTGEGPPYLVLPLPEPQDLVTDESANYYLLRAPEGIPPPLVCVRHVIPPPDAPPLPATHITVYSGTLAELLRAVDWLQWKRRPICLVPDPDGLAAQLRAGRLGNRVLIDDGKGLLEGQLWVVRPDDRLPAGVAESPNPYLPAPTMDADEREWTMRWRELTDEQRAALRLILKAFETMR